MDDTSLLREIMAPRFPYKTIDPKNDVELSVGIAERCLQITFLGSETVKDWLHNFMFWKKPYSDMEHTFYVHAGFLKIYKLCRKEILEYLNFHFSEFDRILILGHSLGGAIATLCYEDMQYQRESMGVAWQGKAINGVVTGAPRVFSCFNNVIPALRCMGLRRLLHGSDGVPTLPPAIFGYKHVGFDEQFGERHPCVLKPSFVYDHDGHAYIHIMESERVEGIANNSLYATAWKVYKHIYLGLGLLLLLAIGVLIL